MTTPLTERRAASHRPARARRALAVIAMRAAALLIALLATMHQAHAQGECRPLSLGVPSQILANSQILEAVYPIPHSNAPQGNQAFYRNESGRPYIAAERISTKFICYSSPDIDPASIPSPVLRIDVNPGVIGLMRDLNLDIQFDLTVGDGEQNKRIYYLSQYPNGHTETVTNIRFVRGYWLRRELTSSQEQYVVWLHANWKLVPALINGVEQQVVIAKPNDASTASAINQIVNGFGLTLTSIGSTTDLKRPYSGPTSFQAGSCSPPALGLNGAESNSSLTLDLGALSMRDAQFGRPATRPYEFTLNLIDRLNPAQLACGAVGKPVISLGFQSDRVVTAADGSKRAYSNGSQVSVALTTPSGISLINANALSLGRGDRQIPMLATPYWQQVASEAAPQPGKFTIPILVNAVYQ